MISFGASNAGPLEVFTVNPALAWKNLVVFKWIIHSSCFIFLYAAIRFLITFKYTSPFPLANPSSSSKASLMISFWSRTRPALNCGPASCCRAISPSFNRIISLCRSLSKTPLIECPTGSLEMSLGFKVSGWVVNFAGFRVTEKGGFTCAITCDDNVTISVPFA